MNCCSSNAHCSIFKVEMSLGALSICTKKLFVFSDEMSNGTVQPGENFPGMPSKVFLFFRFNRNDWDKLYHLQKSHLCHSLTHGRQLCEPGTSHPSLLSSTGSFFTNGTASYFDPFLPEEINCSTCSKNPTQKFHANGQRSSIQVAYRTQISYKHL